MDKPTTTAVAEPSDVSFLDKLLHNQLSETEARQFASQSPEFITFTLLALQQRLAASLQSIGPNTPSAAIPPFAKPNVKPDPKKKSKKKRGGQPGHPGRTRESLVTPDRTREHYCSECPEWGGHLVRTGETRRRLSKDIPVDLNPFHLREAWLIAGFLDGFVRIRRTADRLSQRKTMQGNERSDRQ